MACRGTLPLCRLGRCFGRGGRRSEDVWVRLDHESSWDHVYVSSSRRRLQIASSERIFRISNKLKKGRTDSGQGIKHVQIDIVFLSLLLLRRRSRDIWNMRKLRSKSS